MTTSSQENTSKLHNKNDELHNNRGENTEMVTSENTSKELEQKIDWLLIEYGCDVVKKIHFPADPEVYGEQYIPKSHEEKVKSLTALFNTELEKRVEDELNTIRDKASKEVGYGGDMHYMAMGMLVNERIAALNAPKENK